ncbi:rhomboid family intramembrane serine protease [Lentibacillus sp. CBA3610]|uniref:rhomboid family intramembrane serine protease n=1 Tax=Lentibacillus sp. CBA3610 TaxID=2518176 RepID=UPI001595E4BE|nr:rhomboid family intramembrane serine protease [Lentibacillus sp. CBA3610]QKY71204.1 rhomboid family intramembrane serine protease [Lentibacillus sp. CBA3610]
MLVNKSSRLAYLGRRPCREYLPPFCSAGHLRHVGRSGAIYGLFGIYVFMVAFRKHLIDQSSSQIITIILVIGLIMTFMRSGINVYSHVFGFIGGFALAPLVLNNVRPYMPWVRRRSVDDGSIQFDPNRWAKKKQRNKKIFKKRPMDIPGVPDYTRLLFQPDILKESVLAPRFPFQIIPWDKLSVNCLILPTLTFTSA